MKTELVNSIKLVMIKGVKRRILIILNNSRKWMEAKTIHQLINNAYKEGYSDQSFSQNWVYIQLRELETMGLVDKRTSMNPNGFRGQFSRYQITATGISKVEKTLNNNNYSEIEEKLVSSL